MECREQVGIGRYIREVKLWKIMERIRSAGWGKKNANYGLVAEN